MKATPFARRFRTNQRTPRVGVATSLDRPLAEQLYAMAERLDVTPSALVRQMIRAAIARDLAEQADTTVAR